MPTIGIKRDILFEALGQSYSETELVAENETKEEYVDASLQI